MECQNNRDFEYIIIDGGSTDNSLSIINKYDDCIDYHISEPDSGVYNAMNKGILKATGDYCLFLNSGDTLYDKDTISRLNRALQTDHDIYYSDCAMQTKNGISLMTYPSSVTPDFLLLNALNHQNELIRTSLLLACNKYREDMKIMSDWLLTLKAAALHGARFNKLETPIAIYEGGGISTQAEMLSIARKEAVTGIKETFPLFGESLAELFNAKQSVFGFIVYNYGYNKILHFLLRIYRFLATRIPLFRRNGKQSFSNIQEQL